MKKELSIRKMKLAAAGGMLALTLIAGSLMPGITAEAAVEKNQANVLASKASSRREAARLAAKELAVLEENRDLTGLQTVSAEFLEFEIPENWDEESFDEEDFDLGDDEIYARAYGENVKDLEDIDDFSEIDVPMSAVVIVAMSTDGISGEDFDFDMTYLFDEETFAMLLDEMMVEEDYDLTVERVGRTPLGNVVKAAADDGTMHSEVYVAWGKDWMYVLMSIDMLGATDGYKTAEDIVMFGRPQ